MNRSLIAVGVGIFFLFFLVTGRLFAADVAPEVAPQQPEYRKLVAALDKFRRLQRKGGWRSLSSGPVLKRGDSGERVVALRKRLVASGELPKQFVDELTEVEPPLAIFDDEMTQALMRFQKNHDLTPSGELDAKTLAELNVPIQNRIQTLQMNIERFRWLPRVFATKYVLVDIAGYEVRAYRAGEPTLTMRAMVGGKGNETPLFTEAIDTVVLNPWWSVPHSIAVSEALPALREDPKYLKDQGVEIYRFGKKGKPKQIDPEKVDWAKVTEKNFPYLLKQSPGPENPLGQMKFVFPNRFAVYLHGTMDKGLFESGTRALSHGCVRVEDPVALGQFLFKDSVPPVTVDELKKVIAETKEKSLKLELPIPVYFVYWTAWVGDDNQLRFRKDVYGWDEWDQHIMNAIRYGHPPPTSRPLAE